MTERSEVLILGAGVIGLSCAYFLAKAGRDVEKSVLSRALELVLNERVFVYGNKTVVFK